MTGYGEQGPDANQPGFDSTAFFARSGLLDALTHEGGPLAAILDPIFASHPWPEWRKRLRHHEITFGLLGVLRDLPHDERAVANGAIVPSNVPEMPRTISVPIRLSFAPVTVAPGPGPAHGQHTDELLAGLGYSRSEMRELRQAGALG